MEVELTASIDESAIVMPAGLPGYEAFNDSIARPSPFDLGSCIVLQLPNLQFRLRTNNYYMGMSTSCA